MAVLQGLKVPAGCPSTPRQSQYVDCRDFLRAVTRVEVSFSIRSARTLISVFAACTFAAHSLVFESKNARSPVAQFCGGVGLAHKLGFRRAKLVAEPKVAEDGLFHLVDPMDIIPIVCMHAAELEQRLVRAGCIRLKVPPLVAALRFRVNECHSIVVGGQSRRPQAIRYGVVDRRASWA